MKPNETIPVWKVPKLYVEEIHLLTKNVVWRGRRPSKFSTETEVLADAVTSST